MGFGSYDESERENQRLETDLEEGERSAVSTHDGDVEFEYDDATTEDLFEIYEQSREQ